MKILPLFIAFLLLPLSMVYGQTNTDTVDDLENRLKSEEFNVGLLLQSVGVLSLDDDNFNGGRQFELGATRLDIKGQLPSNFIYRMQLDFRRSPSIIDAQVGYWFSDQFRIVTGMFKPFLSADLDPSPAATDFINRARLVGSMLNSRELGITALGETEGFNYRFGIYNGNGRQLGNDDNNFLYTARLGYQVNLEDNGTVDFGLNGAVNTSEGESVGNSGLFSAGDRTIYGAFVKYDSDTFFGTIEFLQTDFEVQGVDLDETITGFYATVGNNISEQSQLLARWDHLSYDVLGNDSNRMVLGWNYQATQLVSFQLNGLLQFNDGVDNQAGISGNLQFHF
ncbi:porin [Rhodohalobacter barkolensis]|uniref:Porin n=1 Tax=Rhodohalobacter barkolensis TaxID=2053187 RepID=A0A2N0VHE7_9BACT|nr:porin [Rhodohalobacter barkolensis]PKD43611.1 hypothetical protein CWD77_08575 [Rhodohalobacter barkolensis]